ncbi:prevent-host-death family protein [[Leptolyngbya] sp. PCC 7376]|uniref:prevent-host-death family protein n=1 Tax=[Leptolyngbya] sp. PCC 7376 TaxID=111781 RepID=UPI00029F3452|nr:prevent-host-death family protein [[Leptolyngbya] sp. PCC 7376]AFY40071.1 prevent-host-death family protein [[Leptolyngbya] sp. PCC 7376]
MSSQYKQIPMSEMRVRLPKLRRLVQLGKQRIVVTYYGEVIGFLLPISDIERCEIPIDESQEMSLSEFRSHMTETWELLQAGVDCIFLTFHTRAALVFIAPKFAQFLDLPVLGNQGQMLLFSNINPEATV